MDDRAGRSRAGMVARFALQHGASARLRTAVPPDGLGRLPEAFRGTDLHQREPPHDRQAQLTRTTFTTSRLLDFASARS